MTGSCTGGVNLACDGPEDCNNGKGSPYCCANIDIAGGGSDGGTPTLQGGNASCTADCGASFAQTTGGINIQTRLCHAAPDCAGLSFNGFIKFDKCCGNPAVPGLQFCGPAQLSGQMGLTCN
jgi:hypothetical protein